MTSCTGIGVISAVTFVSAFIGGTLGEVFRGYRTLLGSPRGRRTYGYVLVNSLFHSEVFTWLGVYLERRYGLGATGIGLAWR